jgi:hypothetical protein
MKIELINGSFSREDTVELLTDLISTKIKFHERKISLSDQLEDIQFREKKIKKLSEILKDLRSEIHTFNKINIIGELNVDFIE